MRVAQVHAKGPIRNAPVTVQVLLQQSVHQRHRHVIDAIKACIFKGGQGSAFARTGASGNDDDISLFHDGFDSQRSADVLIHPILQGFSDGFRYREAARNAVCIAYESPALTSSCLFTQVWSGVAGGRCVKILYRYYQ